MSLRQPPAALTDASPEPYLTSSPLPPPHGKVAVIDDDPVIRRWLMLVLQKQGYEVVTYEQGREALRELNDSFDVVCLDLSLGDGDGLELLHQMRESWPGLCVIIITGESRTEMVVRAMREGAYDYLVKPLEPERVGETLGRAMERQRLRREVQRLREGTAAYATLVGESAPMASIRQKIEQVAESDVTVCVLGETGTGKELTARAVHLASRRHRGPFVALNCGAIPESLLESELFGHEKGAFTGALSTRRGKFEQANGGTLFLDEIGEMSLTMQASLLRVLQQRTLTRLGGAGEIAIDVRILSATHRDLRAEVEAGRFRQDLYYRLVVFPIHLPPLRERRGDLPALVVHLIDRFRAEARFSVERIHPDVFPALAAHDWPGNIRELENVIHRTLLALDGPELTPRHLPLDQLVPQSREERAPSSPRQPVARQLKQVEAEEIQRALVATGGNVVEAAARLGMSRATLYRRLASLNVRHKE